MWGIWSSRNMMWLKSASGEIYRFENSADAWFEREALATYNRLDTLIVKELPPEEQAS